MNLADEWDEKSEFSKLVGLILRTHGVERIYVKARSIIKLDKEAPDSRLPTDIIDQVSPHLREKRTPAAFRRWLTLTRKLCKLIDYLPFMPFDSKGPTTFRHYERLANEDIQQLRNILDHDVRAQGLAKVGRAFRDRVLKRQSFLWEDSSSEKLSKLPDHTFLHLLTVRRSAGYDQLGGAWYQSQDDPESAELRPIRKQCDFCEVEICELFTLSQYLASKQPTFPGPQLQLALRRKVPDTAQSITFAMNGDIDGLKYLFSLGLASPRDESDSRRFSLISVGLTIVLSSPRPLSNLLGNS